MAHHSQFVGFNERGKLCVDLHFEWDGIVDNLLVQLSFRIEINFTTPLKAATQQHTVSFPASPDGFAYIPAAYLKTQRPT